MSVEILPSLQVSYNLLKRAIHNEVVFINGPPSTGKTTIAKKIFQEDEFKDTYLAAYVDCYSVATPSKLLSIICQAFHSQLDVRRSRNDKTKVRLPEPGASINLSDFPRFLNEYYKIALEKGYKRLYVIVDHVELFDKTNLMDTFIALCRAVTQSLYSLRLVIVSYEDPSDIVHYISQKSIAVAMSFQDRIQVVTCGIWSMDDTVKWILSLPPKKEVNIYSKFVKNIVTLNYMSESKDPRHIRMYCQQNFEEFLDFRKQKTCEHIRKGLKLDADALISDEDLELYSLGERFDATLVHSFFNSRRVMVDKRRDDFQWTHNDVEVKIPMNTSNLIIAAYISAHTRPSDDKLNFIVFQRGRKSKSKPKSQADTSLRPFTLERLIQIWIRLTKQALGERNLDVVLNNDCVLADVERLENLNILHHYSGYELSSEARYKLSPNIKRSYVQRLANNLDLDLNNYQGLYID